jgi:alkylation response protein AidB-like acyl-CoA dehydrogenase
MDLRDTPAQARFRETVRAWLRANLPEGWGTPAWRGPGSAAERVAFARAWQRRLFDGGWAGLDWPAEYGGRGAGPLEHVIYLEEYARAEAPDLIQISVGTSLVGPVLIAHGTPAQRERHLPAILRGEEIWCQGFSEPGAGSDLASLRTRAELDGDAFVVSGQKIWTSFAQHSDACILVVRTDPEAPKHRGLSFLLVDMRSPGITVRPLRELTGEAWFNEVFFDRVRVPCRNLVGELHGGWDVVVTTLAHERGTSAQHARLAVELEKLAALARRTPRGARPASEDPLVRQKLAAFAAGVAILRATAWRNASRLARTGRPGPEGSTLKLLWSELDQRVKDLALEILGPAGLVAPGDPRAVEGGAWGAAWLWSRASTIYAGTSEIQRNIIAGRVLGLPRT